MLLTLSAAIDIGRVNASGHDEAADNPKNTPSGGRMRASARCRRERMPTASESAIRPRFVPDSFHSLNTAANNQPNRRIVIQIRGKGSKSAAEQSRNLPSTGLTAQARRKFPDH